MSSKRKLVEKCNNLKMLEPDNLTQEEEFSKEREVQNEKKATERLESAGQDQLFDSVMERLEMLKSKMNKHFNQRSAQNTELIRALNKCMSDIINVQVQLDFENTGTASKENSSDSPAPNKDK